jgi:hypothetical protein
VPALWGLRVKVLMTSVISGSRRWRLALQSSLCVAGQAASACQLRGCCGRIEGQHCHTEDHQHHHIIMRQGIVARLIKRPWFSGSVVYDCTQQHSSSSYSQGHAPAEDEAGVARVLVAQCLVQLALAQHHVLVRPVVLAVCVLAHLAPGPWAGGQQWWSAYSMNASTTL